MANEQNLIPFNERTESEKRKIATQGGIASGEARRKKKMFAELAETALSMKATPKTAAMMREMGIDADDLTQKMACVFGMLKGAQSGNVKAFEKLQELTGELSSKEVDSIEDLTPLSDLLK